MSEYLINNSLIKEKSFHQSLNQNIEPRLQNLYQVQTINIPENLPKINLIKNNLEEDRKNIGKLNDIAVNAEQYKNEILQKNFNELKQIFPLYRQIRGDGNSFYRAIGVAYIQNLIRIKSPQVEKQLQNLINDLSNNKINNEQIDDIPQEFQTLYNNKKQICQILLQGIHYLYVQNTSYEQFQDAVYTLLNENYEFDFALIIFMRTLTLQILEDDEEDLQAFDFDGQYIKYYQEAQTYGKEAEGYSVQKLPKILNVEIVIHQVDKNDYSCPKDMSLNDKLFHVHLFFRPDHYDLCYFKEQEDHIKKNYYFNVGIKKNNST
ncbi:hypothetical protein PPERSA_12257 [Pseudocohnilembus persalinus]|uniref:ubiquitinyl hydrolase 1 n=1 Tax=Pseudocohnilembus persalinus TaxID=266149 RepID=A0A0V0R548_PSEPJ|nr:hypothetical protein PPERSA_12257 [Pseudocohnilembus persalinus]|eukprot:KRX09514.1 hypothetical protein PPERSA_12257 [Pseudocohnilembus persalinus]